MKDKCFYKVYITDIDNIIKSDSNSVLVRYLKLLKSIPVKDHNYKHFISPSKFVYISYVEEDSPNSYAWMIGGGDGYGYYIKNGFSYAGKYTSRIYLRKDKLDRINKLNNLKCQNIN